MYCPGKRIETSNFDLAGQKVTPESSIVHLGIKQDVSGKVNIEETVTLGRKTAGFHSVNGLKTRQVLIIGQYLSSLALCMDLRYCYQTKKEFECIEKFQRQSLRQIQGLPDKTPNSITLALLGMLPLKTVIHKNVLNLFMNIERLSDSVEFEIAKRQQVMKDSHEKSWFNYVELLDLYGLPSIFELFENAPPKLAWEHLLKTSVNFATEAEWKSEIEHKSSLKYVKPEPLSVGKCHPVWSTVRNNLKKTVEKII